MTWILLATLFVAGAAAAWSSPAARSSVAHLLGFMLVYAGERLFAGDPWSATLSLTGTAVIVAGLLSRHLAWKAASGSAKAAQRGALAGQIAGVFALLLYALTTDAGVDALGFTEDAARSRWVVSWTALWPILWLAGTLPMVLLDAAIAHHARAVPNGARRNAITSGLAAALGIALVFPVNYLASEHDVEWDFSYFRVTRPGSSTEALVRGLKHPTEVILFYPPASEVREKIEPYFTELSRSAEGKLTVRVVDQPMEPKLSEELAVRDNGYIVLRQEQGAEADGEAKVATEKFRIDPELKKAKKDLKTLDGTFQKHLLKLDRGKRVVYMLTGHGEAGPRETNPLFKLAEYKALLRSQNYDVKDFGLDEGSASAVPDDAALLIVAAPEKALLPEEVTAINRYVDGGGHLLVMLDPKRDALADVLGHIGLAAGTSPLAHATKTVPVTGGAADRFNLFSQRFGTHASVSTLSKYATKAAVVLLTAVGLTETNAGAAPAPIKLTALIRSNEDTWEDADGDAQQGPSEPGKVHVLAYAAQGPDSAPYRAIVLGDVSLASDFVVQRNQGAGQLLVDGTRWLIGDDDIVGETENEEDVQIEHTREDDIAWFYGTIVGFPLLLLAVGFVFVRARGRKA